MNKLLYQLYSERAEENYMQQRQLLLGTRSERQHKKDNIELWLQIFVQQVITDLINSINRK